MKTCHKPGCGAEAIPGKPCSDFNCPQSIVTADDYHELERENAKLRDALTCVDMNIVTFNDPAKMDCAYFSPAEVRLIRAALAHGH